MWSLKNAVPLDTFSDHILITNFCALIIIYS